MITAFQLILTPFRAWEKINAAQWGVFKIFLLSLVPFLLLTVGVEAYSLQQWGEPRGELDYVVITSRDLAIRYSAAQLALLLASIFLGAKFLLWIAHSFQVYTSYKQCFTLMAYGFSPIILFRLLDAIPKVNTWVCWGLGALLSIAVLYQGVGLVLRPEQTKGFGLYLVSVIIIVLSSGLSHFVAVSLLHGRILR